MGLGSSPKVFFPARPLSLKYNGVQLALSPMALSVNSIVARREQPDGTGVGGVGVGGVGVGPTPGVNAVELIGRMTATPRLVRPSMERDDMNEMNTESAIKQHSGTARKNNPM